MNLLKIKKLEFRIFIGNEEECVAKRRLLISLAMKLGSISSIVRYDDVNLAVNTAFVCKAIEKIVADRHRMLIETLAEDIASGLCHLFPIKEITVEVEKFSLPDGGSVAIEISRKNHSLTSSIEEQESFYSLLNNDLAVSQ